MRKSVALGVVGFATYLLGSVMLSPTQGTQDASEQSNPQDGAQALSLDERLANDDAVDAAALERTRKQVTMLDGIYKNAIVLITEHYVNDPSDLPAGEAFKQLFEVAKANDWHEVRLLDATDQPSNDENLPADEFEEAAIAALLAGEAGYEQIIEREGRSYLRSATAVPVVMDKCVMCHDHYADVEAGTPIGALSYTIPIE